MKSETYVFVYERVDGSSFDVINKLRDDELAVETAKFALSKHRDLRSCIVHKASVIETITRPTT